MVGYKTITLSTLILAENKTSECLVSSILTCFKESGQLLNNCRSVTMEMFPHNANLLDFIPSAGDMSLSKLNGKGMAMVHTCNTACIILFVGQLVLGE